MNVNIYYYDNNYDNKNIYYHSLNYTSEKNEYIITKNNYDYDYDYNYNYDIYNHSMFDIKKIFFNNNYIDHKNSEFYLLNDKQILYYLNYYNDFIYTKIKKNININDDMKKKMLNDFMLLLTFYGNDFTLKVPSLNINPQSFISILIIYVRSLIEY